LRNVAWLGLALAAPIILAHFESNALFSSAPAVLCSGPSATAALIFAHNSVAASVVTVGMSFYAALVDALPEKFRRREGLIVKHVKPFSPALAILIVLNSLRAAGGLFAISLNVAPLLLPVAAVEAYGLYLAALYPLQRRLTAANMAKAYALFLVGAILEAALIDIFIQPPLSQPFS